jgi:hypothetical protein
MLFRPFALALVVLALAACGRAMPGDPAIGFDEASALPADADLATVVAAGGRTLGPTRVRGLVGIMGDQAFLRAIDGAAGGELVVEPDGRVCFAGAPPERCRVLVADGTAFRLFTPDGAPAGTLTPSAG